MSQILHLQKTFFRDASFKFVYTMIIERAKKSVGIALKLYLLIKMEKDYLNKRKDKKSIKGNIEDKINAYYAMINTLTETIVSIDQLTIYVASSS